jgi:glycosyltransferase involved in cell wall biosynthesis
VRKAGLTWSGQPPGRDPSRAAAITPWSLALPVLIDGRHLSGFGARRGFGRYLRSLLSELAGEPALALWALVPRDGVQALPHGVCARVISRSAPGSYADFEHRLRLPLDIARSPAAIFHSSASEPPLWCSRPWVQTLHDIPLSFESADHRRELRAWVRRRRGVKSAAAVVAVSQYVADRAIEILDLDPMRVHVAHHGVAPAFRPSRDRVNGDGGPAERDPYLLLVSEYGPHKGYGEAFQLISRLADAGHRHRLIVAGTVAPWWREEIARLLNACSRPDRVTFTDYIDDESLRILYRRADAVLVTSRAEGFGLPAIEAMACATPVVAFDNTALPEIVGSGGTLVRDGDVAEMAEAVHELVTDAGRWRVASAAAYERSRHFSWHESARVHAAIYARVGGSEVDDAVPDRAGQSPAAVGSPR